MRRLRIFKKNNEYCQLYYAYFYLSFAYYEINELEKAIDHLMRGGYAAFVLENKVNIYFVIQIPSFKEVTKKLEIEPGFIKQLREIL